MDNGLYKVTNYTKDGYETNVVSPSNDDLLFSESAAGVTYVKFGDTYMWTDTDGRARSSLVEPSGFTAGIVQGERNET